MGSSSGCSARSEIISSRFGVSAFRDAVTKINESYAGAMEAYWQSEVAPQWFEQQFASELHACPAALHVE